MKRVTTSFLLLVMILMAISVFAQKKESEDINLKRSHSIITSAQLELWIEALRDVNARIFASDPKNLSAAGRVNWINILTIGDKLWKEEVFQTTVSTQYLARVPLISKPIFDEWSGSLLMTVKSVVTAAFLSS